MRGTLQYPDDRYGGEKVARQVVQRGGKRRSSVALKLFAIYVPDQGCKCCMCWTKTKKIHDAMGIKKQLWPETNIWKADDNIVEKSS